MTSIGAGVIHAAAAGVHAEHPQLARLFVLCAVAQVGAGLLAWAAPEPSRCRIDRRGQRRRGRRVAGHSGHRDLVDRRSRSPRGAAVRRHGMRVARRCRRRLRARCGDGRQANVAGTSPLVPSARRRRADDSGDAQQRHPRAQPRRRGTAALSSTSRSRTATPLTAPRSPSRPPIQHVAAAVPVVDESQPHTHAADGTSIAATLPTGRVHGTHRSRSTCPACPA